MTKISIAVTTHQRTGMLFEATKDVIDDDRVSEIVIVDDFSEFGVWDILINYYNGNEKVKLFRNNQNLGVYKNKRRAVEMCMSEYVCLWDSDNIFDKSYIDKLYEYEWWPNLILAPTFGKDLLDFRKFDSYLLTKKNIHASIDEMLMESFLNTCNFFVNKNEYLRCWQNGIDPMGADSIFFMYHWFKGGNRVYATPDLHYIHTQHPNSHHAQTREQSVPIMREIERKIRENIWE